MQLTRPPWPELVTRPVIGPDPLYTGAESQSEAPSHCVCGGSSFPSECGCGCDWDALRVQLGFGAAKKRMRVELQSPSGSGHIL